MPTPSPGASGDGPTYDKLCVRESLDHLRHRQTLECERRVRYANLINQHNTTNAASGGGGGDQHLHQTAVYAQVGGL